MPSLKLPREALPSIALSVRQPWAWAIVFGGKDIENRGPMAVRRGGMRPARVAVHAAKGMTRDEYDSARDFMRRLGVECPRPDDLIRGAVIGAVDVIDIVKRSGSPWFFGPRGLVLQNPGFVDPVPARGQLGYFDWRRGGEVAAPAPWMAAWPNRPGRATCESGDLFGGEAA